jgi:prevent-host-death family protein
MKQATISYTKNHLSALLEQVKRGETITILDRTKPVARMVPIESSGDADWDRKMDEMEQRGITKQDRAATLECLLREPPPKPKSGFSITDAVIQEREESR